MRRPLQIGTALLLSLACAFFAGASFAETIDVSLQIRAIHPDKGKSQPGGAGNVLVWLTPLTAGAEAQAVTAKPGHYRLAQKGKQFTPHLLVIPTGSSVDFPNLDPFFHNVFSLFNGKRFDLGLYETGTSRIVHFDHDGVSYIFCNIHPEMSAIVVTLPTPYFGLSQPDGALTLQAIPPATYEMHVWAEGSSAQDLNALSRRVVINAGQRNLGTVDVIIDSHFRAHKNKFGEDYQDPKDSLY